MKAQVCKVCLNYLFTYAIFQAVKCYYINFHVFNESVKKVNTHSHNVIIEVKMHYRNLQLCRVCIRYEFFHILHFHAQGDVFFCFFLKAVCVHRIFFLKTYGGGTL